MDRKNLLGRIAALLNKTTENGCTEAEAMAAADLASKLMTKHMIDEAEVAAASGADIPKEMGTTDIIFDQRHAPKVWAVSYQIDRLSRTTSLLFNSRANRNRYIRIYGDAPNREFAAFLFRTVDAAMDREYASFALAHRGSLTRADKPSFLQGMSQRVNSRIHAMAAERDAANAAAATSRALVVIDRQQAEADAYMKSVAGKIGAAVPVFQQKTTTAAWYAGDRAGHRVSLNREVGVQRRQLTH